jgi:hypothetical protein
MTIFNLSLPLFTVRGVRSSTWCFFPLYLGSADGDTGPRGEFSKEAQVTEEQRIILCFALTACVPTPGFSPEEEMVVVLVGDTWQEPPLTLVCV